MTENIEKIAVENTPPARKLKFGEAFYNIMSLPFRIVGLVWKAYWTVVKVVCVFLMAGIIAASIRSAFPMNLPEANGVTYYQFLQERWDTLSGDQPSLPRTLKNLSAFVAQPITYFFGPFEIPICEMYPGSKFDTWVRSHLISPDLYETFKPSTETTWSNLPARIWETWERSSWYVFNRIVGE